MSARLVLFDIDGTLLRPCGLGRKSLVGVFASRFGVADAFAGVPFHGRTDPDILGDGLRNAGGEAEDYPVVLAAYLEALREEVARSDSLLLPGAREVLDELARRDGVQLGLVTGNVPEGARLKLERDGLWGRFALGAFGGERRTRAELIRLALDRAGAGAEDAIYVGDTVHDVRAAQDAGVRVLAVASGGESREALAAARPDALRDGLTPTEEVLEVLLA